MNTNEVNLYGKIKEENFVGNRHSVVLEVARNSSTLDLIPVVLSEEFDEEIGIGRKVEISGDIKSYDRNNNSKHQLFLDVIGNGIAFQTNPIINNQVKLVGRICSVPTYRETPLGREISDFMISVRRNATKIDHIPCIAWRKNSTVRFKT